MAKVGIDSFLLDCHLNDKIGLIEAEFGIKGFAVIVKVWQKIYVDKGYYCEWNSDVGLLFATKIGVGYDLVLQIIEASIKRDIFSKSLYNQYGILSSKGIQVNYLKVVKRRECIELKKEYLLLSDDIMSKYANISYENVNRSEENVCRSDTSKVKESKVNKKICIGTFVPPTHDELQSFVLSENLDIDCGRFINFYQSKNWMVGGNKMTDWKASARNWKSESYGGGNPQANKVAKFQENTYDYEELEKQLIKK